MAYLTYQQYIARFGEMETVLLTNDTAAAPGVPRTPDTAKVESAISDAEEIVEGYLGYPGGRYVIPIANPPRIVQGWTAALAREALFVNVGRVSDAVTEAADRARAQLKDAQAGRLTLPVETGEAAPQVAASAGNSTSTLDGDAPTFAGTGILDAYTSPLRAGYNPCWRQGT